MLSAASATEVASSASAEASSTGGIATPRPATIVASTTTSASCTPPMQPRNPERRAVHAAKAAKLASAIETPSMSRSGCVAPNSSVASASANTIAMTAQKNPATNVSVLAASMIALPGVSASCILWTKTHVIC